MPVLNGERYVSVAVGSVIAQSFQNWELVIIDDGSTDASLEIVRACADPRIRIVRNEKSSGLAAVRNQGIELAGGKYLAWLDQDDIATADRLEKQVSFLEANPDYVYCGSHMRTFGAAHQLWPYPESDEDIRFHLQYTNVLPNPAATFRLSPVRKSRIRFRSGFAPAEDYHFWSRLMAQGRARNIPECLVYYRLHDAQASNLKREKQNRAARRVASAPVRAAFGRRRPGVVHFFVALSDYAYDRAAGHDSRESGAWSARDAIDYFQWRRDNGGEARSRSQKRSIRTRVDRALRTQSLPKRCYVYFRLLFSGHGDQLPNPIRMNLIRGLNLLRKAAFAVLRKRAGSGGIS